MTVPSAAISTQALSKRFGERAALSDVSLRIEAGRTYGLIGLNGAGKSTLIRAIVGLLPPSSGSVSVAGLDPWSSDGDRVAAISRIGYVPDRPHVYAWMRVRQAIEFAAKVWARAGERGQGPGWNGALAERLLRQYRLDPEQKCGKLSKGQGAKLSLLLALAHEPSILVLDEPTDGLDPVARDEFLEQVLDSTLNGQERDEGRTVLISSHALGDLQKITDSVGILHQGKLVVQAPTAELLEDTKRLRVVLDPPVSGPSSEAALPVLPDGTVCQRRLGREWTVTVRRGGEEAVRALRSSPSVTAVSVESLSLDELFKDVVRGLEPAQEGAA